MPLSAILSNFFVCKQYLQSCNLICHYLYFSFPVRFSSGCNTQSSVTSGWPAASSIPPLPLSICLLILLPYRAVLFTSSSFIEWQTYDEFLPRIRTTGNAWMDSGGWVCNDWPSDENGQSHTNVFSSINCDTSLSAISLIACNHSSICIFFSTHLIIIQLEIQRELLLSFDECRLIDCCWSV